ncbi:stalk domain-containing protein [Paenibacillus sp. 1001270B_150601_E10]|uniref:stalk domain-containing protein n=1 Tax=Paenibacillus sp. 1001270B_150601_E10 TaxID=2787079 RepID=UPI00189ED181|nr:stalk domain-containing protein [Paenibacillus sp. 1001270B_150601_E10]
MFEKWAACLLTSILTALTITSMPIFAAEAKEVSIHNGQMNNGRILVPLRAVSENLGVGVRWFPAEKEVKMTNGDSTIWLAANFKRAIIETPPTAENPDIPHREYMELDTATQVINGTTYVPLRFVSQSIGATITWDEKVEQANVTLDGKRLIINIAEPSITIPEKQRITDTRLKLLSDTLNEASNSNILSIKNIPAYFKPYFTDRLIQSIVANKGLETVSTYGTPITLLEYTSKTSANLSQSVILGNGLTAEDQYVEDRSITLVFTDGMWKVDRVSRDFRILIYGFADELPS